MPPGTGRAPPERLVPLPRATKGTPCRWHQRTAATTSSAVRGAITAAGRAANAVSPSLS